MSEALTLINITENDSVTIPDNTKSVYFSTCVFKEFPVIPNSVKCLYFDRITIRSNNPIEFHEGLEHLSLEYDTRYLSTLIRKLPSSLKSLEYRKTGHGKMPDLPDGLEYLTLTRDYFTEYPDHFPSSLISLDLSESHWTSLPDFPQTMQTLNIWGMKMEKLPEFPPSLKDTDLYIFD